ncbi:hypothetical protein LCGC14_0391500 [marine sediment metagenome]|uniref:Sialidase domain-containing protein n=1 Tax=marine sediment metagenome TaxID=412755 RepID=A0A0F9T5B4_9ZZZZ
MYDANLLLLNRTDYDSGNDGAGSGTDETSGGGRIVDVAEGADVAVLMALGEADATIADTTETLDMLVQISRDGGSTWGTAQTFRQITASELNGSGTPIDESAGDVTFKRAVITNVGIAEAGNSGIVKMRLNGTASDTNHWAPIVTVVTRQDVREEWLDNAFVS